MVVMPITNLPLGAPPTLLELKTMKGADDKPLRIVQTIAAHDYTTFGMCLLQDENGEEVKLIKKNHIQDGAESVTEAIIQEWLTSDAPTCTCQHLIECLRQSELGALAKLIENTRYATNIHVHCHDVSHDMFILTVGSTIVYMKTTKK